MTILNYHNVSLNSELTLGARVKVMYHTKVIRMREGDEERVGEWQDALRTFDLTPALRHQADLDYLIAFFRARLGPTFAFKLRDPTDFIADAEIFGTGNGTQTVFQLVKGYTSGLPGDTHTTIRPIVLPDVPLVVYVGGIILATSAYTVDDQAGIITFTTPPAVGAILTWSGTFHVPVRFQTTQMYTTYAMYQRFEAQITLQEVRAPVLATIRQESEPEDFVPVLLPPTFAERSESGPQYDANIISMVSGQEVRIGQFLAPKVAFQVDQAVQTALEMEVLINFFHARRGRLQGFLALDYTDFQAVNEFFGSGDGITTVWQLVKHYFSEAFAQVRSITHLASAVVAIFQDGMLMTNVRVVTTESGMDVLPGDPTLILPRATVTVNGSVTFAIPPPSGALLTWTGTFYVPVRFDTDELDISVDGPDAQSWSRIGLLEIPNTVITTTIQDVP